MDGQGAEVLSPRSHASLSVTGGNLGIAVAAGDVTGDGQADIVAAGQDGDETRIVVGLAGPVTQSNRQFSLAPNDLLFAIDTDTQSASSIAVGDVDFDGRNDLVIGFARPREVSLIPAAAIVRSGVTPLGRVDLERYRGDFGSETAQRILIADYDGDGLSDLLIGSPRHDGEFNQTTAQDGGAVSLYAGADRDPVVVSVSPVRGPQGPASLITIRGHGFAAPEVTFITSAGLAVRAEVVASHLGAVTVTLPTTPRLEGAVLNVSVDTRMRSTHRESAYKVLPPTERVRLVRGWNLVGATSSGSAEDLTTAVEGTVAAIFVWDTATQGFHAFTPDLPHPNAALTEIARGQGMWIRIDDAAGAVWRRPTFAAERSVALEPGFNLVTWTGPTGTHVTEAIAGIADAVIVIHRWDATSQTFQSLNSLLLGPPTSGSLSTMAKGFGCS